MYLSCDTKKFHDNESTHTYYIIFGRPSIGGKLSLYPPGGATELSLWRIGKFGVPELRNSLTDWHKIWRGRLLRVIIRRRVYIMMMITIAWDRDYIVVVILAMRYVANVYIYCSQMYINVEYIVTPNDEIRRTIMIGQQDFAEGMPQESVHEPVNCYTLSYCYTVRPISASPGFSPHHRNWILRYIYLTELFFVWFVWKTKFLIITCCVFCDLVTFCWLKCEFSEINMLTYAYLPVVCPFWLDAITS